MAEMRFVIVAEPAPVPSLLQLLPPSSVPQSPFCATPAITMFEHGFADTKPRLPHSDAMLARFPVEFIHFAAGAVTAGAISAHWNVSGGPEPPAPPELVVPPVLAPPLPDDPALP